MFQFILNSIRKNIYLFADPLLQQMVLRHPSRRARKITKFLQKKSSLNHKTHFLLYDELLAHCITLVHVLLKHV